MILLDEWNVRSKLITYYLSIIDLQCVNVWCSAKWCSYIYSFSCLFHYGPCDLLKYIYYSSLSYTVGACCLSILYMVFCICQPPAFFPLCLFCTFVFYVCELPTAAAAAKSLQLCPTLCDPTDSNPPGSTVPGILQARILEWVAISFSNAWKWKVKVKSLSRDWLLATSWTAAYQAPLSMGFSRQEYWSGMPLPSLELITIIYF